MKRIVSLLVICFFVSISARSADGQDIAEELKSVVLENLQVTQAEDLNAMMQTIHTQSPVYLLTKQQTTPLFENYDIQYELLSFKYFGIDGVYAIARVKQQTTKKSGPAFQNNEIDMIQVFRKENRQWKFWNQMILEINYIK